MWNIIARGSPWHEATGLVGFAGYTHLSHTLLRVLLILLYLYLHHIIFLINSLTLTR